MSGKCVQISSVPWADLVLTAAALVATINLFAVLLVARAAN
jgi:hypothetical protein